MDELPAAKTGPHLIQEADVGSGEKSPGQQDTEALINQIAERPAAPAGCATPASAPTSLPGATPDPGLAVTPDGTPVPADSTSAGPP